MASVITFFFLAAVGSLCGVPPFACATRAVIGAVIVFILAKIVVRLFINIMVNTIVKNSPPANKVEDLARESGTR